MASHDKVNAHQNYFRQLTWNCICIAPIAFLSSLSLFLLAELTLCWRWLCLLLWPITWEREEGDMEAREGVRVEVRVEVREEEVRGGRGARE